MIADARRPREINDNFKEQTMMNFFGNDKFKNYSIFLKIFQVFYKINQKVKINLLFFKYKAA